MSAPRFGTRKKVTKAEVRGTRFGSGAKGKEAATSLAQKAKLEPFRNPQEDAPCTPPTPEATHEPGGSP